MSFYDPNDRDPEWEKKADRKSLRLSVQRQDTESTLRHLSPEEQPTLMVYFCAECGKKHEHTRGYIFKANYHGTSYHFCNVDCCDDWEDSHERNLSRLRFENRSRRKEAVEATKKKHEDHANR